jgi:hypothetical protein
MPCTDLSSSGVQSVNGPIVNPKGREESNPLSQGEQAAQGARNANTEWGWLLSLLRFYTSPDTGGLGLTPWKVKRLLP